MNDFEIVKVLNRNLEKEYGSVLLYIQFMNLVETAKERGLKNIVSRLAEDEMRHAEKISDRIVEMGGEPSWRVSPFDRKSNLRESIEQIIASEEDAIREYTSLISKIEDLPKVWITLKEILEDEKSHRTRTEALLRANISLFGDI